MDVKPLTQTRPDFRRRRYTAADRDEEVDQDITLRCHRCRQTGLRPHLVSDDDDRALAGNAPDCQP